jgi:hypothetical protein
MTRMHLFLAASAALVTLASCAPDDSAPDDSAPAAGDERLEARVRAAQLVQAGTNLVVLGVTDDDHALYWDAGSVYATALEPGAERQLVAAASQPPMTLVAGRVAMVWTAQVFGPPAAPSPLVVWTAAGGPRELSAASFPPTQGAANAIAAVSPDSREVLFATDVSADGASGDIARAAVDGSCARTLVEKVDLDPVGACGPHIGFDRNGPAHEAVTAGVDDRARPAAAIVKSCPIGESVATLSTWAGDARVDLSTDVQASGGGWWTTDPDGKRLVTLRSDGTPVLFDLADGKSVAVEDASARFAWIGPEGEVFTMVRTDPPAGELHRTTLSPSPRTEVVASFADGSAAISNHLAQGLPYYNISTVPPAADGRLAPAFTRVDPDTGLTDLVLLDTGKTNQTPVRVEDSPAVTFAWENATRDSSHLLYYTFEPATGALALFAAARDGARRQLNQGPTGFIHFGTRGSDVAYANNATGGENGFFATTDIEVVDVAAAKLSPVTIAREAYIQFFPARDRGSIVYTSDADPDATGLYVARAR